MAGCFGMYIKEFDNISWFYGHPDDAEWLKPKIYQVRKHYRNTPVTDDLIWDERTPVK